MLVVMNFEHLDEEQHAALRTAMNNHVNVADWHQFFGHSYIVKYVSTDDSLNPLYELCKKATMKGDKQAYVALNRLYKGYAGWGPQALWDFVKAHVEGTGPLAQTGAGVKERSPYLVDPEMLLLKENISLESLMLDRETESAVHAQLVRAEFQQAAAAKGVTLPEAYQNLLISGKAGVGKSTLAKALAIRLRESLPADRKRRIYFVKPAQLIGAYRGHTQLNMQTLLDHAADGIIILDEIDTYLDLDSDDAMILNVLNTHMGDKPNWPIIIGTLYEGNKPRFMKFNQGFQRRFANGLSMGVPDDSRLMEILLDRIESSGLAYEPEALQHMKELIHHARRTQGGNFGNIGELNNILDIAVKNMGQRYIQNSKEFEFKILARDVPEYDPQSGKLRPRLPTPANDFVSAIAAAVGEPGGAPVGSNVVQLTFDRA
jgi:SpoVK/Ycf46/Vps4 family AAA+-type ATPase